MATSRVFNSSPREQVNSDPEVVNDKDSAQPMKKKLKQSGLSDREIFEKWCICFHMTYKDDNEKEYRFKIFQSRLKPPFDEKDLPYENCVGLADRTDEEYATPGLRCFVFESDFDRLDILLEFRKLQKDSIDSDPEVVKDKDSAQPMKELKQSDTNLPDRQIFDKWCSFFQRPYKDENEKEERFKIFQSRLNPPFNQKDLPYPNRPGFADRTDEELGVLGELVRYPYVFQSDIDMLDEINEYLTECETETESLLDQYLSGCDPKEVEKWMKWKKLMIMCDRSNPEVVNIKSQH